MRHCAALFFDIGADVGPAHSPMVLHPLASAHNSNLDEAVILLVVYMVSYHCSFHTSQLLRSPICYCQEREGRQGGKKGVIRVSYICISPTALQQSWKSHPSQKSSQV